MPNYIDFSVYPANPTGALLEGALGGYGAMQNIQGGQARNALVQQRLQAGQREQSALAEYGKTGDPKAFRGVDPKLETALTDWLNKQEPESLRGISKAADFFTKYRSIITPQSYPHIKKTVEDEGWLPKGTLPDSPTPEQLQQLLYMPEIIKAWQKKIGEKPSGVKWFETPGGGMKAFGYGETPPPGSKPYEKPKEWKPEILVPLSGKGAAINHIPGEPIPEGYGPLKAGTAASQSTPETITSLVEGLKTGNVVPSQLSRRAVDYNKVVGEAVKQGLSLPKLQLQYEGAKKFVGSMNSQQMVRFKGLAGSVVNTIDEVRALAEELKLSGITPLNRLQLQTTMKVAGNTPSGQLAARYLGAVNTLKEEFANLAQGGYAPTEAVWTLANKQINENYGVDQMKASLTEIQRLINFRINAFDELTPYIGPGTGGMGGGKGKPGIWNPTTPTTSGWKGAGRYRIDGQETYFNSEAEFKQHLGIQ
jgi:hypothetical protein